MTHVEWKKVTEFSKPCLGDMLADWTEERQQLIEKAQLLRQGEIANEAIIKKLEADTTELTEVVTNIADLDCAMSWVNDCGRCVYCRARAVLI